MKKIPKNPIIFECKKCNYNTVSKKDYNKHLLTAKHKYRTNGGEKSQKIPKTDFECECGKVYKARNSLWYHTQKCPWTNKNKYDFEEIDDSDNKDNNVIETSLDLGSQPNLVLELLRENQEFKQMLFDQNKQMQETQIQLKESYTVQKELQSQMVELYKEGKTINNNNQSFNLNFFLNDTCKDAMNITDFLNNISVKLDELDYIGNHGYVNGMTKMILDRLKEMDITKRPIHCTDIKRETMYIKDKDEWSKDTDELTKLRRILSRISMANYRTVPDWKNAHPESEVMESRDFEFCYKMMRYILGDVEEEQIKLDNKIIKKLAKDLFVKK